MNIDEYISYISEITELEKLIKDVPKDRIFVYHTLRSRLKRIKNEMEDKFSEMNFFE